MRKFVSDDGSSILFQSSVSGEMYATEAEAIADENAAQYELKVDAFVSSREWKRGQDTRATALITEFLAWCDTAAGQSLLAPIRSLFLRLPKFPRHQRPLRCQKPPETALSLSETGFQERLVLSRSFPSNQLP